MNWPLQKIPKHTIMLFFRRPKICISIVFSFSWELKWPQEILKTMLMQNFGVTNKEHYGMLWYFWSGQLTKCFWSRKGLTSHDLLTRSTNEPFSVVGFCFNTYPKPLHRTSAIWWPYWTLWQPSDTGKHPQITSKQIPPDRSNESWLLQTHTVPIKKRDSPSSNCP